MSDLTPDDVKVVIGKSKDVEIAGERLRVVRLKARDYLEVMDKLAESYASLIAASGGADATPIVQVVARWGVEVPELLARALRKRSEAGEITPVPAAWVIDLDALDLLDVCEAVIDVNELETILGKVRRLQDRVTAALAGPKS